jgi:hypothetical protein
MNEKLLSMEIGRIVGVKACVSFEYEQPPHPYVKHPTAQDLITDIFDNGPLEPGSEVYHRPVAKFPSFSSRAKCIIRKPMQDTNIGIFVGYRIKWTGFWNSGSSNYGMNFSYYDWDPDPDPPTWDGEKPWDIAVVHLYLENGRYLNNKYKEPIWVLPEDLG